MVEKETKKGIRKKNAPAKKKENPDVKKVEFSFYAPEASEVFLAGEFNQWDTRSLLMTKDEEGIWRVTVELNPGTYEYKFFVDSFWFEGPLPDTEVITNPFGTKNFVKEIL